MIGREAIDDETWTILFSVRSDLVDHLTRLARVPRDIADDCVSEALIDVVVSFNPVEAATTRNDLNINESAYLYMLLKAAANKRLGAARRHLAKHLSDDTPIGEEDGEMHVRDLFVARHNTAERVENYTEWKMFSRKGGCPYSPDEIDSLFGVNHIMEF